MNGFSVKHPADICSCCDDCGANFTLQHGMDYKKGPWKCSNREKKGFIREQLKIVMAVLHHLLFRLMDSYTDIVLLAKHIKYIYYFYRNTEHSNLLDPELEESYQVTPKQYWVKSVIHWCLDQKKRVFPPLQQKQIFYWFQLEYQFSRTGYWSRIRIEKHQLSVKWC